MRAPLAGVIASLRTRALRPLILGAGLVTSGCSNSAAPLVACASSAPPVALAVGGFNSTAPDGNGCVTFPNNAGTDTTEYLIVVQATTGNPDRFADFQLTGDAVSLALVEPVAHERAASPVAAFHALLRDHARHRFYGGPPPLGPPLALVQGGVPIVGAARSFGLCSNLACNQMTAVGGRAVAVGQNLAIYVDTTSLATFELTTQELDSILAEFDTRLFPIDTASFGAPSDRDQNGVVAVLMTPVVNRLVTAQQCATSGFVSGYFYGADLDAFYDADPRFSHGEVYYSIVPDPAGAWSCPHTAADLKRAMPVTFIHELQHMISFNQHVLVRSAFAEEPWLDEGLSHFAEELGGRSYPPSDTASFSQFVSGDIVNAYRYLDSPGARYLVTNGAGSLEERGAAWLFVRFFVDQQRADTSLQATQAVTRDIVERSTSGAASIVAVSNGRPFDQTLARWALAQWVSDLPAFTAPPELRYRSWFFRTTFSSIHNQAPTTYPKTYPLTPDSSTGSAVNVSGVLHSGSGFYHRVIQAPGAPGFTLQLSNGYGQAVRFQVAPRLAVVRIR